MDKYTKEQIIEHYKKAFENVDKIASGERPNWMVLKHKQYLSPTTRFQEVPLDDDWGEFKYYNKICENLERLLAGEKAEYICYFNEAPEEIKKLLTPIHAED